MFKQTSSLKVIGLVILVMGITVSAQALLSTWVAFDAESSDNIVAPINVRIDNVNGTPTMQADEHWRIYNKTSDGNSLNFYNNAGASPLTISQDGTIKSAKQINSPKYCDEFGNSCQSVGGLSQSSGGSLNVPSGFMIIGATTEAPSGFTYVGPLSTGGAAANTWSNKTAMPVALNQPKAVSLNGKIYVIGKLATGSGYPTANLEYDPAANSWTSKTTMPTGRSGAGVAVVNGKIYVIGGVSGTRSYTIGSGSNLRRLTAAVYSDLNEEYDPTTNKWVSKKAMLTQRADLAVATVGSKIYAIGGSYGPNMAAENYGKNEEYDTVTNTWTKKRPLPSPREQLAAVTINNKIYAIGGWLTGKGTSQVNQEYDPATDSWATKAKLPTMRSNFSAVSANGKLYVIGGNENGRVQKNEEYNPATDSWASRANMLKAVEYAAAAETNGNIYLIGGFGLTDVNKSGYLTDNQEYHLQGYSLFRKN